MFVIRFEFNTQVNNLPSSFLLVGYSGYVATHHSLHSVQTQKGKKNEAISRKEHALKAV